MERARAWLVRRLFLLCWLGAAALAPLAGVHLLTGDQGLVLIVLHALTAWLYLPALLLFPLAVALRSRSAWPLGAVVLIWAWSVVPGTVRATPLPEDLDQAPALELGTANLLMVHPDPAVLLEELVTEDPDVLVLQEYSPRWEAASTSTHLPWPHREVVVREDSFGVAIYSRLPMTAWVEDLEGVPMIRAQVQVEGQTLEVLAVHTLPPRLPDYVPYWQAALYTLGQQAEAATGPLVLAGDLNLTRHAPSYGELLSHGLTDAHASRGRAGAPTWPNGLFLVPPMRLDHLLLTDGVVASEVREGVGAGSDHRPVFATLHLVN